MTLLSVRKVWLLVQRVDGKCNFLKLTRNRFVLHRHTAMSLVVETHLILLEDLHVLLLVQDCPVSRWTFSEPDLLQIVLLFHLQSGIWNIHHFGALSLPLHWVFSRGFLMRPSFPTPLCLRSRFFPRAIHIRGIFQVKLSYRTGGVWTSLWQKRGWHSIIQPNGTSGPLNGSPNRR